MSRSDIVQAALGGPDFTPKDWPPAPERPGEMIECAICGDYSAQGVEVHEVCLDMLSRAVAPVTDAGLREAQTLLNSLGIVGPNIIHRLVTDADYADPESGIERDGITDDEDWCVCGRVWPCEAQRLGEVVSNILTLGY